MDLVNQYNSQNRPFQLLLLIAAFALVLLLSVAIVNLATTGGGVGGDGGEVSGPELASSGESGGLGGERLDEDGNDETDSDEGPPNTNNESEDINGETDSGDSHPNTNNESEDSHDETDTEEDPSNTNDEGEEGNETEPPSEIEIPPPPYDITLTDDPTPGIETTVVVSKNDEPVSGVEVFVNGESFGFTDRDGEVQIIVPYDEEMTIQAERPPSANTIGAISGGGTFNTGGQVRQINASDEVFPIETATTVEADSVPYPGLETQLTFNVDGNPLSGVRVSTNGVELGTTDSSGNLDVILPQNISTGEELALEVHRENFNETVYLTIGKALLSIETGLLYFPGLSGDVSVHVETEDASRPISNATVAISTGGEPIEYLTTGEDGTGGFTLPWENQVTATLETHEGTITATESGLLIQAYALAAGVVVLLLSLILAGYRNPEKLAQGREYLSRAISVTVGWIVSAANWLKTKPLQLSTWVLRTMLTGLEKLVKSPVPAITAAFHAVIAGLLQKLSSLWSRRGLRDSAPLPQSEPSADSEQGSTEPKSIYERLLAYWAYFVQKIVGGKETETAVEIERKAVSQGYPEDVVQPLRKSFQKVEYGGSDPDEHIDGVVDAVEAIDDDSPEDGDGP